MLKELKEESSEDLKRFSPVGHALRTGVSQGYARRQGGGGGVVVERGSRKRGEELSRWLLWWYVVCMN